MKTKALSTEELEVPGVSVVESPKGKAFAGPYYADQLDLLRETLRGMPRREKYEVATGDSGFWIYKKPTQA